MKTPEIPVNESERLKALSEYRILGTKPEQNYDDITKIASLTCDTPIALLSLVDTNRQWFKSKVGVDVEETDLVRAQVVLDSFGDRRPAREGRAAVGLDGGAARLAEVIRAFDEAGITVEHLELDAPSLDDVFADATGRRLEGVEAENE